MLQLITGVDIPIPELQIAIHQPTIKEISYIGEERYFSALQIVCFNKQILIAANQGNEALDKLNDFDIFMTLINDPQMKNVEEKKESVLNLFLLLFPNYNVQFLPHGIYFNNPETKHNFTIDENNFLILQSALQKVGNLDNSVGGTNSSFNPKNERAAKIAAKLMKGRARAAQSRGEGTGSILSRYVSILTIGLNSMSLESCLNLTVYQLYDLIERFGLHTNWDLDIKSRLAGGKPDSKPDDWMKNIH